MLYPKIKICSIRTEQTNCLYSLLVNANLVSVKIIDILIISEKTCQGYEIQETLTNKLLCNKSFNLSKQNCDA
jgi:hypothetical protein